MTNELKFKAILERAKIEGWADDPTFISVMVIINYLDHLKTLGMVECGYNMTDAGKKIVAICEEFDWKPSDKDISEFIDEMFEEDSRPAIEYMLRKYRDDKDSFLKEIEDFNNSK